MVNESPDAAIRVTLLGTGTPILNVHRFGMSTLVEAGGSAFLFDVGRGASIRLHQVGLPHRDITAVFITHLHSDHITGLPDLYATAPLPTDDGRRKNALELYGPDGIESVAAGIQELFLPNNRIRTTGGEIASEATEIHTHLLPPNGGVVFEKGGVVIEAFLVDHGHVQPAYGFRIRYAGRSVVLSGDTTYSSALVEHARGADLLVHSLSIASRALEAAKPDYVRHFYDYLASPETVGRVLDEARPGLAVFSHISLYSTPEIPRASEDEMHARVSACYAGPFIVGQDLMAFRVTALGVVPEPYSPERRSSEP